MAFSLDLREKVIKHRQAHTMRQTSDTFKIAKTTILDWKNSTLFEHWFDKYFCPEISGNIVVLDNATIHRKEKLFEIAKKHDVTLLFLPPYSPECRPS